MIRAACISVLLAWELGLVGSAQARPADNHIDAPQKCASKQLDPDGFRQLAACEAKRAGLPPQIAYAVMEIESGYDPEARGAAGEVGLMQVMPSTARMLGFQGDDNQLAIPEINVKLGVLYLAKAHKLAGGDLCTTVMKYRAGHGEHRFSARSVDYCLKARRILRRDGHQVAGTVPAASFGFPARSGSRKNSKSPASGSCVRRILVPGPRFRQCAAYGKIKVTRHKLW